jgi:hypothetical protein
MTIKFGVRLFLKKPISLLLRFGLRRKMKVNQFFQSSLKLCSFYSFHSTLTLTLTFHPTGREEIIGEHSANAFGLESRRVRGWFARSSRWSGKERFIRCRHIPV